MFESAVGGTGSSGNGIQFSVELDNSKKWDGCMEARSVCFTNRDRIPEFIMPNQDDNDNPDWYITRTFASPVRRNRGTERILTIQDNRLFGMEWDRLNRRIAAKAHEMIRYKKKYRALSDITLPMKRSTVGIHQDTLNGYVHAREVYE